MEERVILVDDDDNQVGTMEKMEAHLKDKKHRAFSVFVFNLKGELLLQQRALDKYHSGGKWTNTCCSHPRPGEDTLEAAHRRLMEEMGMDCPLNHVFSFSYRSVLQANIVENEYDHVFFGVSNTAPNPSPGEVEAYRYISLEDLARELYEHPADYTEWLKICFEQVRANYYQ
ncbi:MULTISPECIES: isopentenyl-diphosphate Delta-isomerase [unclassified Mucilaginibacter]|jgi:isopentenyl-diphosphate delta-isomerase|uniref:isopentenyl-diphosphate Delta-isomerase n=1 Tax=unclassified Mucilaginibacter TaxID=2617802 RepID=UPI0008B1D26E|nr:MULTISPECIES: isopentenyl-diphosphate Delta-isomerase [unclassified Mucilaginibacter]WDF75618.1 isopentenyl-diphosphate Delta-isomerase [Mucilaginibacter sp. KACC 22773]SEP44708.1 isopentenyl-diphosphate delta-isomerase [Mucilaginibacter sp. OK283]